jgi:hypothetical protein
LKKSNITNIKTILEEVSHDEEDLNVNYEIMKNFFLVLQRDILEKRSVTYDQFGGYYRSKTKTSKIKYNVKKPVIKRKPRFPQTHHHTVWNMAREDTLKINTIRIMNGKMPLLCANLRIRYRYGLVAKARKWLPTYRYYRRAMYIFKGNEYELFLQKLKENGKKNVKRNKLRYGKRI